MKILVISDTHGYIGNEIIEHAQSVDEVWHAGDIGSVEVLRELQKHAVVRAVYGNIDAIDVRQETSKNLYFETHGVAVCMTHIGGYPGKYNPDFKKFMAVYKPHIIICGHSHILKVMHDSQKSALFINPGAIGKHGFHTVRTMIEFEIVYKKPQNMKVLEYNRV